MFDFGQSWQDALRRLFVGRSSAMTLPSGVNALDAALPAGGFPLGGLIVVLGAAGSGKTTLALQTIATAQRQGLNALYVFDDVHRLYAKEIGVDLERAGVERAAFKSAVSPPDLGARLRTQVGFELPQLVVIDSLLSPHYSDLWFDLWEYWRRPGDSRAHEPPTIVVVVDPETTGPHVESVLPTKADVLLRLERVKQEWVHGNLLSLSNITIEHGHRATARDSIGLLIREGHGVDAFADLVQNAIERSVITQAEKGFFLDEEFLGEDLIEAATRLRRDEWLVELLRRSIAKM